jgi:hypothetical protein
MLVSTRSGRFSRIPFMSELQTGQTITTSRASREKANLLRARLAQVTTPALRKKLIEMAQELECGRSLIEL